MLNGVISQKLSQQGGPSSGENVRNRSVREAAEQFEALLIGQMLKEMRTSETGGWLGGGEDASGGTMIELAEEQLARALTSQGGLGLASMIGVRCLSGESRCHAIDLAQPDRPGL
jgi:Rod binding domain-containing protein